MKSKTQLKTMPKNKKKMKMLELEKINKQLNKTLESINFFSRKPTHFFNLKNEKITLQAEIMQDKKKPNQLRRKIKKIAYKNGRVKEYSQHLI